MSSGVEHNIDIPKENELHIFLKESETIYITVPSTLLTSFLSLYSYYPAKPKSTVKNSPRTP